MPQPMMRSVLAFVPEALTASQVGTWTADFVHDSVVGDEAMAALFGIGPDQAEQGLPLASYAAAIHPEDRPVFSKKIERMRERGGLYVIEYRTCPQAGVVRWVLARGRFVYDEQHGGVMGRGIVIDITESKLDGHVEDRAFLLSEDGAADGPLERAADLALATREMIDRIAEPERPALRKAVDALLWAMGRALARRR